MKKLLIYVAAILATCSIWSCQSPKILSATFEGDAVNNLPAKDLPGDPAGDVIEHTQAVEPQLKVQNATIAGAKALHYTNVSIGNVPGHQRGVSFKGVDTDLTKTIWFTHTGQNTGASSDVTIYVSDGHGHMMARMRIASNGDVGLANDIATDNYDVIGNIGSEVHTIIFTLSPSSLKYNVTIFKTTGPTITAENKSMLTEEVLSFNNPANPKISFLHNAQAASGHTYAIGSVDISKEKP